MIMVKGQDHICSKILLLFYSENEILTLEIKIKDQNFIAKDQKTYSSHITLKRTLDHDLSFHGQGSYILP